jgi:hypothetical protein
MEFSTTSGIVLEDDRVRIVAVNSGEVFIPELGMEVPSRIQNSWCATNVERGLIM